MNKINRIQDDIIKNFAILDDREEMLDYLIELGSSLPSMLEKRKIEKNKVVGCLSSVWVWSRKTNNKLFYEAESNSSITQGLVSLILLPLNGQSIHDIIKANLYILEKTDLKNLIGSQRTSGYISMVDKFKLCAIESGKINIKNEKQNIRK